MVLLDILRKPFSWYILQSIPVLAGIMVGGAAMIYLFTIPAVTELASLALSQIYAMTAFGIIFFSANVGGCVGLFIKHLMFNPDFLKIG